MINNYFTLRALVTEWAVTLVGSRLEDVFSQEPDELTLAFTAPGGDQMVRIGTRPPLQFMFRDDGYSKARRNVATLFEEAFNRELVDLRIADRDRIVCFDLAGELQLRVPLFGPHANVLLVERGTVRRAFRNESDLSGTDAPEPRPAPSPQSFEAFQARWRSNRNSVAQAVSSAYPLFDRTLGREVAERAGIDGEATPGLDEPALHAIYEASEEVRQALQASSPRIYWDGEEPAVFSLLHLAHLSGLTDEALPSVDVAARVFVRRSLGRRRYHALFDPVKSALNDAVEHYRTSADRMLEELSSESRAEQYEKWGHLLMARSGDVAAGSSEITLEDLFEGGTSITIPLDPASSAIENAQTYYDRARRTRRSREEAEHRLLEAESRADEADALLVALGDVEGLRDVQAFRKEHAAALARYLPDERDPAERVPFRRFDVGAGFEVWVGRNARQNDDLTFHHAQKYDLWMHARGVPGSHAVLRFPNRNAEPDRRILQRAAAIAAFFSKARGSAVVPVMMTARKYVRKPRGAGPGAVAVEREEVIMVEPGLPK